MRKIIYPVVLLCTLLLMTGCEKYETYSDMKEKERDAIESFINSQGIQVIDEATFKAQGETTNTTSNQYVRFDRNGVYMQIVRKGCGTMLENKKNEVLDCRFIEKNIMTGEVVIRNDINAFISLTGVGTINVANYIDRMNVYRNGTTITGSFVDGLMYQFHNSASVPAGWLVPLNYVKVGYPEEDDDEIAKVRLIVPHSQGTADASSSVTPYFYEITYQRKL